MSEQSTHTSASAEGGTAHRNRLADEKSPYLLQHAANPVNWYPWGNEAFEKAKKEDKPVFLSIGYSTCHWCHVMERETFENEQAAELMNETFVSIKVDREERPDIDHLYMTVCQMMTGGGGWPLNVIMTPDKKPFFAATYIPRENRYGRIGMMELTRRIQELWTTRRDEVLESAGKIVQALKQVPDAVPGEMIGAADLDTAYTQLRQRFDEERGGFSQAPKFPTPHNMLFLLRYRVRTGESHAVHMVEKTLKNMRLGGIYDHIGYGFHRYSTDNEWLVPHFEKMLYDQALMAMAYTEAYQTTGNKDYADTVREVFTYVLRDMVDEAGGFYSAEDADSEGVEGKFYVWTVEELKEVLTEQEANFVIQVFNVHPQGNFREEATGHMTGANILHARRPFPQIAAELGMEQAEFDEKLEDMRRKLFEAREKRIHPGKDDKILTDWNGLMIAAMAKASQALGEPQYAEAAGKAADFILTRLRDENGRLLHRYRHGDAAIDALVDDYAFLIWGLLELYEATFETRYLEAAIELNDAFVKRFWDEAHGGFFFTSDDADDLIVRKKELYDGATPSGNSVALLNMLRLGRITANFEYDRKAEKMMRIFAGNVKQFPSGFTQMLSAVEFAIGPSYEVVIAGERDSDATRNMLSALREPFVPNKVVLFRPAGEESPKIADIAEYTLNQTVQDGTPTAYVCQNFNCNLPTTDPQKMLELLGSKSR